MNNKPYSKGPYNKFNDIEQWIRITEGCPNNCEFCRETKENGPISIALPIPTIICNKVKIMDMNFIARSDAVEIMVWLGEQRVDKKVIKYELICGVDYRFLTEQKAMALYHNRFINIRIAWDSDFNKQIKIKDAINLLKKAGYNNKKLSILMICNWKIPYLENLRKLDLCKIWGVKVNDCWFDNQLSPNIKLIYWEEKEIKDFRHLCRKHNQMVLFGIDPEQKS